MIDAMDCPDGIYGPTIMAVHLRVENGVVTVESADDHYDYALKVGDGQFHLQASPVGKHGAPRIRPLLPTAATPDDKAATT